MLALTEGLDALVVIGHQELAAGDLEATAETVDRVLQRGDVVVGQPLGLPDGAEQARMGASMQRNLRLVVIMCAAMLLVLWFKQGAFEARGGAWTLGLILIGALAAWVLGNRRRS